MFHTPMTKGQVSRVSNKRDIHRNNIFHASDTSSEDEQYGIGYNHTNSQQTPTNFHLGLQTYPQMYFKKKNFIVLIWLIKNILLTRYEGMVKIRGEGTLNVILKTIMENLLRYHTQCQLCNIILHMPATSKSTDQTRFSQP